MRRVLPSLFIHWICNRFLATSLNWIICRKERILAKIVIHLQFLEVAGDSPLHRPYFNRIDFCSKRLKLRIISRGKPVWLRGFCVRSLGGDVRWVLRSLFIHRICNRSIGFPSHHCELDHMPKIDSIGIFWRSPEIHLCRNGISTELIFIKNA